MGKSADCREVRIEGHQPPTQLTHPPIRTSPTPNKPEPIRAGKQTDVAYQEVAEIRTAPRLFGAYGDMVVVLRNGDKVEIRALEKYQDIKNYILERRDALTGQTKKSNPAIMDLDRDDAAVGLGGGAKKGKGFS